jgi:potassium-transporting ATPase potassium-binding subunit
MSDTTAGVLQVAVLLAALALCYRPLGAYLAASFTSPRHLRVERLVYRAVGVDPDADQRWPVYARSLLAFSAVSVLFLYALQRLQPHLPLSLGFAAVSPDQAWDTAASFVTNTNWQSYSGEATMGHLVQMAGLAVQNFASAAVGLAVAVALIRGFARSRTNRVGNFWVDLVRGCLRVLVPLAFVGALILVATGAIQNFSAGTAAHTLSGGVQHLTGGPVASQESIKELGTNGGGFYNANSAHPFENPNPFSNIIEIFLLLLIPVALTNAFGRMVGDKRQGYAVLATMGVLLLVVLVSVSVLEAAHPGTALQLAGGSMEGKDTRFGDAASSLFATSTTGPPPGRSMPSIRRSRRSAGDF